MMTKNIKVAGRVASYLLREGFIVCGNSDYRIAFSFDEEWDEHETKTARFIWNGGYYDQEFTGTECPVPVIHDTDEVRVGVYAGDLWTTTAAVIPCRSSILDGTGVAQPEQVEEFRDQAAVSAAAAKASEEAAKVSEEIAVNAATKAGKDAAESAAANAAGAVEKEFRALIDGAIVQDVGDNELAVMSQKATTQAIAESGLRGYASGETVQVDDVNPVAHLVDVWVHGKNLLNDGKFKIETKTINGVTITANSDGSYTLSGENTSDGFATFGSDRANDYLNEPIIPAGTYTPTSGITIVCRDVATGKETNKQETFEALAPFRVVGWYCYVISTSIVGGAYKKLPFTFKPQLEQGDTATEYTPYLDPTTVTLVAGADSASATEYTPNADGSVDGVMSCAPTMYLFTDTEGVTVELEYTKDLNQALENLEVDAYSKDEVDAKLDEVDKDIGALNSAVGDISTLLTMLDEGGAA